MKFSNLLKKIVVSLVLLPSMVFACINDMDTRYLETQNFPEIADLFFGKFPTHGKDWYEWRIETTLEKIKKEPTNWDLYDDLAIAYEKTHQYQQGIDTLLKVQKQEPNRYQMLANLGTIYIHNGEYKKGLELLKKALVINPEAHYGREKYQILLVEYLIDKYPNEKFELPISTPDSNFYHFLKKQEFWPKNNKAMESQELSLAIRGMLGMLRFGNSDSPILLEELNNLFIAKSKISWSQKQDKLAEQQEAAAELAVKAILGRELVPAQIIEKYAKVYKFRYTKGIESVIQRGKSSLYIKVMTFQIINKSKASQSYVNEVREFEKLLLSSENKENIEELFNKKYYGSDNLSAEEDLLKKVEEIKNIEEVKNTPQIKEYEDNKVILWLLVFLLIGFNIFLMLRKK